VRVCLCYYVGANNRGPQHPVDIVCVCLSVCLSLCIYLCVYIGANHGVCVSVCVCLSVSIYVSMQVLIIGHQGILRILYGYLMWTEIQVLVYPILSFSKKKKTEIQVLVYPIFFFFPLNPIRIFFPKSSTSDSLYLNIAF